MTREQQLTQLAEAGRITNLQLGVRFLGLTPNGDHHAAKPYLAHVYTDETGQTVIERRPSWWRRLFGQ